MIQIYKGKIQILQQANLGKKIWIKNGHEIMIRHIYIINLRKDALLHKIKELLSVNSKFLTKIILDRSQINHSLFQSITNADLKFVKELYLIETFIDATIFRHFISYNWKYITILTLYSINLDNQCFKLLMKANLVRLKSLNLESNQLDNHSLKLINKAKWPQLRQIWLNKNILSNVSSLIISVNCLHLEKMHVFSNDVQVLNINLLGKVNKKIKNVWFGAKSVDGFQQQSKSNLCRYYKNYDFENL